MTDAEAPVPCSQHVWRLIECGGSAGKDRDLLECTNCKKQQNVPCDFDEEYA